MLSIPIRPPTSCQSTGFQDIIWTILQLWVGDKDSSKGNYKARHSLGSIGLHVIQNGAARLLHCIQHNGSHGHRAHTCLYFLRPLVGSIDALTRVDWTKTKGIGSKTGEYSWKFILWSLGRGLSGCQWVPKPDQLRTTALEHQLESHIIQPI